MFRRNTKNNKGVSSVIGYVLIIGISMASIGVLLGSGSTALMDLQTQVEVEQAEIETSLISLAQKQVSSSDGTQYVDLNSQFPLSTSETHISLITEDGTEVYSENITTLKMELNPQESFYISSGGVFRTYESGYSEVISRPTFSYEGNTISFSVLDFYSDTEFRQSANSNMYLTHKEHNKIDSQLIENDTLTLEIDGEEYQGWGQHIEGETDSEVFYDHDNESVAITFGIDDSGVIIEPQSGIYGNGQVISDQGNQITGDVTAGSISGKDNITGETTEGNYDEYESIDTTLNSIKTAVTENGEPITIENGDTIESGTYYHSDDLTLTSETTTFDAQNGNITLVVDGEVSITNSATVDIINTTDDTTVEIIADRGYKMNSGSPTVTVDSGETGHHKVYLPSDRQAEISQSAHFEGIIYAPSITNSSESNPNTGNTGANSCSDEMDVCLGGSATVDGAIIGGNIYAGQNSTVNYDESLQDYQMTNTILLEDRPDLHFVHISKSVVEIED